MENFVHFDDDFFKKTIREYQDWAMAFFRETAQNSVDAKAKNVKYTINDVEGKIIVTCEDDGSGMDENILLNKFLVMGGTYKESSDNIGGFGYAKSIILFCHENYEIETRDNFINGSYGRYSNLSKIKNINGTKITVEIDNELVTSHSLEKKLREWVKKSNLKNVTFKLNNEILEQENQKFKYKKQITIGELVFNDDIEGLYKSSICIRMRGMPMFEREIWGNTNTYFQGYVDLNFNSSMECLTSNRDGLLKEYDNALNQLIVGLTTERSQFTGEKLSEFIINEHSNDDIEQHNEEAVQELTSLMKEANESELFKPHRSILTENMEEVDIFKKLKKEQINFADKIRASLMKVAGYQYPKSFLVKIDNLEDEGNRNILKHYNKTVKLINQKRNIKMADVWTNSVYKVLDALCKDERFHVRKHNGIYSSYGKKIHTGFVLSEKSNCYGMMTEKEDVINILLNITKYRNDNLNMGDLRHIIVHEISHIFDSYHNDNHSALMFVIDKIIRDNKLKI